MEQKIKKKPDQNNEVCRLLSELKDLQQDFHARSQSIMNKLEKVGWTNKKGSKEDDQDGGTEGQKLSNPEPVPALTTTSPLTNAPRARSVTWSNPLVATASTTPLSPPPATAVAVLPLPATPTIDPAPAPPIVAITTSSPVPTSISDINLDGGTGPDEIKPKENNKNRSNKNAGKAFLYIFLHTLIFF